MFTLLHFYPGPESIVDLDNRLLQEKVCYRAGSVFALNQVLSGLRSGKYHPVADVVEMDPVGAIKATSAVSSGERSNRSVMWHRRCERGTQAGDLLIGQGGDEARVFIVLSDNRTMEIFRDARDEVLSYCELTMPVGAA